MKMFDFALPLLMPLPQKSGNTVVTSLANTAKLNHCMINNFILTFIVNFLRMYDCFNLIIRLPNAQQCQYEVCEDTHVPICKSNL